MEDSKDSKKDKPSGITRREALKVSGMAIGGMAISGMTLGGGAVDSFAAKKEPPKSDVKPGGCPMGECSYPPAREAMEKYSYFNNLPKWKPKRGDPSKGIPETYIPPEPNEMRITFLGSNIPNQLRRAQQMMSIFVEVGNAKGEPDQFVFDCGCGVAANYNAMGISMGRMDKVFLTHLHGDHMSDLVHIYCFGAGTDRKHPLCVWGGGPSGVKSPKPPHRPYDDGVRAFCSHLREACRWHTESQSFISTSYKSYKPPTRESWGLPCDPRPVRDDDPTDGYAIIPIELDWTKYGKVKGDNVAYYNPRSGVKITHFPVIHCRKGSVGYKLEWNGLSMIYTGDTKPEYHSVQQAAGVTVFIHEINPPAEEWAFKNLGLHAPPKEGDPLFSTYQISVPFAKMVQNSSHTPQGAFGYLLGQIKPRPQLTVGTHFPVADDTEQCAKTSVEAHGAPEAPIVWGKDVILSFDLMVLKVFQDGGPQARIEKYQADVSNFTFTALGRRFSDLNPPRYWKYAFDRNGNQVKIGDPYAQIDTSTEIPSREDGSGNCNYREDGY